MLSKSISIKPWAERADGVVTSLETSVQDGLSAGQVKNRRARFGKNVLRQIKPKSGWAILLDQLKSLIVALLVVAAVLSFAFGDWVEGLAIVVVILINTVIGFVTEIRAVRSMEALHQMSRVNTIVRRDGKQFEIPAEELVPGDIVILEGGNIVSADMRLIKASKLQADESALTGESLPVDKCIEPLPCEIPLAERKNIVFKGTSLTRGSAEAVVYATGMNSELGKISALVETAEKQATPLEKRLDQLGHNLIRVTLALTVLIAAAGILRGKDVFLMIETAIALAVAAIPEGLPIVATIALARGMLRMAKRNALINRLASVETLGAASIICTDKTGTLTENRMTVCCIITDSGRSDLKSNPSGTGNAFHKDDSIINAESDIVLREVLQVSVLCNNASLSESGSGGVGDPLEIALLEAAAIGGVDQKKITADMPEEREEAFDSDIKMMATFNRMNGGYRISVKGAPESVLERCDLILTADGTKPMTGGDRERWIGINNELASDGLRLLALAVRETDSLEVKPYEELIFVGLAALQDPPRADVRDAIGICKKAGIRVVMITGDQAVTARNIAYRVGLTEEEDAEVLPGTALEGIENFDERKRQHIIDTDIFARVSPKEKLDLISAHQDNHSVVAMTGDGVNDAPALKKADIGIAMGLRGTQVAREAADMVLKDDAFSTIVAAIRQGRIIFNNIRKFVIYLLSCNVSEILTIGAASAASAPLPILPLQILFLNLITDVFPALALGVGEGDPGIMKFKPRPINEPIVNKRGWMFVGLYGVLIAVAVLAAFGIALYWKEMGEGKAVTIAFMTLALSQLWHVFNMRSAGSGMFINEVTTNKFVWGALALCFLLLLSAVYLPGLSDVMHLTHPGPDGWTIVILASLFPLMTGQILKIIMRRGE